MPKPDSLRLTLAGEVRAVMARRNVTQRDIADLLGLSQPSISERLRGQVPWTVEELVAVADHLDTSVAALLTSAQAVAA